jgi:tetratricopeptide (TPR) repeat protein
MLVVYWGTLNRGVTLLNIGQVARVAGWSWQPQIMTPLTLLLTLPFHFLSAVKIPVAMNVLSSVCAAAALLVLARTVAILPHDRTLLERTRERSDFSFLTGWISLIPPVAAVIFAGFQLGFWENATNFSGESFSTLWFAVILWQLLEYRLDEREGRLYFAALLYGAGMVENWGLIGFFPLFLAMIIWLRGTSFFHLGFLVPLVLCGFGGFLSLLVVAIPVAARCTGAYSVGIWDAIHFNLRNDWQVIRLLGSSDLRHNLALIALTSLLPALFMSFRWSSRFGDSSRLGATLVNYVMHLVNVFILGVLVWVTFDPPFSPSRLLSELGVRSTALPFYYVIAICIGYYSGYFLLLFGRNPGPSRRGGRREPVVPESLLWICPMVLAGELAALAIGAGLLIYKNAPVLAAMTGDSLRTFGQFSAQQLPPEGAILLCDSDDPHQDIPLRAFAVQAELSREGRAQKYPVVDTRALQFSPYHHYLHQRFPAVWPEFSATNDFTLVAPAQVLNLLDRLSRSNNLSYLNPSFGYFFEHFYQEPHGLVYAMKPLPADTLIPPPLSTNLAAENDVFWQQVVAQDGPAIRKAMTPANPALQGGVIGWFMAHLHVLPAANADALAVGTYYSKSLDALGVQVQRAGDLDRAGAYFTWAQEFNSNNVVAAVNLSFNKALHLGSATAVDPARANADQFGKYRGWDEVLSANGPFDETSFCFGLGCWMVQNHLSHQAAALFDRVRHLAPENLATRLFLAQIYIFNHQPDLAMQALHDPLTRPFRFALTDANSTELNELAAAAHFQKNEIADGVALLEQEMARHPDDQKLLLTAAQTFNVLGLHTNALKAINRRLNQTPDDPDWLFGKGLVSLQAGAYDEAAAALSRLLEIQTNNPNALFDRAIAYFHGDRLDASRADLLRLQAAYATNTQVAYDLGEIAWRQHQTNEAIRNYRIYLTHAPTNAPEQKTARERMTQLDAK